jgi:chemotaxis protein MotA
MISVIVGLSGFASALWYVLIHGGASFSGFWEPAAAVLLGGGPIAIILMSHSFYDFFSGIRTLFSLAVMSQKREMNQISNQLSVLSYSVRTDGIGVLAKYKAQLRNPLLKDGVSLILSSFTTDEIRHNLTAKINSRQTEYAHAVSLFENLGKLSPGVGLLGTIAGLVKMLSNMTEPAKLGPAMAVALLSTLYGLVLGTVVYMPVAEKIAIYAEKRLQLDLMVLEGVLLLKEKKSQAHLRDVLNTYSTNSTDRQPAGNQKPDLKNSPPQRSRVS